MRPRMTVPESSRQHHRNTDQSQPEDATLTSVQAQPLHGPSPRRHPRHHTQAKRSASARPKGRRAFSELIDAKAASRLLGVPYTWLLAQARERKIPHHRLGHYVRFDPDELVQWLRETRISARGERPSGSGAERANVRHVA